MIDEANVLEMNYFCFINKNKNNFDSSFSVLLLLVSSVYIQQKKIEKKLKINNLFHINNLYINKLEQRS